MKILALDPATQCGWAYRDTKSGDPVSGTWDLSTRRDESGGMKLIRFRSKLDEILKLGIDLIVFEAARNHAPGMQGALIHQAQLQAVVQVFAEDNKIDYRGYSPSEIKKLATGRGNAKKEDVMAAVNHRLSDCRVISDHNEADAIALLHLAQQEYAK